MKSGLTWLVIVLLICASASVALGSQKQWECTFTLCGPSFWCDGAQFGVQPGASDGYDPTLERTKGCMPEVCLFWDRPDWPGGGTMYSADWRAPIPQNTSKTWCQLIGNGSPGTFTLTWVFGTSDWLPPENYRFTLYRVGNLTYCSRGIPFDMRTTSGVSWYSDGLAECLYVVVTSFDPPTCSFTITPNPAECPGVVDLDASDSSGTPPLSFAWDLDQDGLFDDAAGVTVTGVNLGPPGTYNLGLQVTDGLGQTATCYLPAQVVDTLPPDWFS